MEGHRSTGQSPQWAVVSMEDEEEELLLVAAVGCLPSRQTQSRKFSMAKTVTPWTRGV